MSLETSKTSRIKYQLVGDTVSLTCFAVKNLYIYPVFTSPEVSRVIRRSLPVGCQKAVDIAFVIDTSGSVKQVNFNKVIQFLKMFVDRFDFPDSGTR